MINLLLMVLAVSSASISFPTLGFSQDENNSSNQISLLDEINSMSSPIHEYPDPLSSVKTMLEQESSTLRPPVIDKILSSINCAKAHKVQHNNILTVIDYSLPSSQKRLWVFDIKAKKLLFNTYVSHGITSGALFSKFFSNVNNSKASSIGVYKTDKAYYGRDGLSLRLTGLERNFNDNAANRSVVMHGGWYVDEQFIKKYGRAGRSWGCPALPLNLYQPIINTIKENSLFVVYYPSDSWLVQSKFLNCDSKFPTNKISMLLSEALPIVEQKDEREHILFADLNRNNHMAERDPIVVMAADNYARTYHVKPPLERMLRRQINHVEYIALTNTEFNTLATTSNKEAINNLHFVIPEIVMVRGGYYETRFKMVDLGKIKEVRFDAERSNNIEQVKSYSVYFEGKPTISLKSTNQFIRWLGL